MVPPNIDVFCVFFRGYDYEEKVDLSKGYWNPKRKMWVTTPFFFKELIKQKWVTIQRMCGNFFPILSSIISEKCPVAPNFLFGF